MCPCSLPRQGYAWCILMLPESILCVNQSLWIDMGNSLGRATRRNSERRHALKRRMGLGRSILTPKHGQRITQWGIRRLETGMDVSHICCLQELLTEIWNETLRVQWESKEKTTCQEGCCNLLVCWRSPSHLITFSCITFNLFLEMDLIRDDTPPPCCTQA